MRALRHGPIAERHELLLVLWQPCSRGGFVAVARAETAAAFALACRHRGHHRVVAEDAAGRGKVEASILCEAARVWSRLAAVF